MHRRTLRLATLVGLLFVYQWSDRDIVYAEERADTCLQACTNSADCYEVCEIPYESGWIFTTCGEYENGSAGGYCDHSTWDTCNFVCSSSGDPETACLEDGVLTDCESAGRYYNTNDGICSELEDCFNSDDCGECPDTQPPGSTGTAVNPHLADYNDLDDACDAARTAGYGNGWDCPDDSWFAGPTSARSCSGKAAHLTAINATIAFLHTLQLYPAVFNSTHVNALLTLAYGILADVEAKPCYLYT
jgi:hypothetical protein